MTDPRANSDGEQPKRLFPERPPRRRAEDPTREQQPARRRRSENGTPEQPQPARRRRPEGPAREARPRRPDYFSTEQPPPRRRRSTDGRPSGQPPSRRRRGRDDLFPEQAPTRRRRGDDLTQERLVPAPRRAPSRGWRAWLYRLTGGLLNLGPAPKEQHDHDLIEQLQKAQVSGHRHIATLSLKGGSGKTTTAVMLGHTLAQHRGDRVVAVDASPDAGTLGFRVERKTPNSLPDLLGAAREIRDYRDLKVYTSESDSRLQVLAARTEPDLSSPFTPDQYRQVVGLLARFYSLIITDCSPGLLHPTMEPVLELADQLLIVVSPSVDGGRSGSLMLDWLSAHGRGDLVRNAVVVLNCLQEKLLVDIGQFKEHFGQRCRAVVQIPFDPHLGQGAETSLEELRPATRTAYLELAAHVLNTDRGGKPAAERGPRS